MTSNLPMVADVRWTGAHGIGRYSTEVLQRVTWSYEELCEGDPNSLSDILNPRRLSYGPERLLYSPGYRAGLSRCRQLVTVHDLIHLEGRGPKSRLHRAYYERVLRPVIERTGHVLTVSQTSMNAIGNWLGDTPVRIHDVGNGCSEIFSEEGDVYAHRRDYFLYVGNLKHHKNPTPVLQAMRSVDGADLIMVTPDRESATRLSVECGVDDRVRVVSGLTDAQLAALYRGATALVMPSILEGFGLPVVEASRSGCGVIYNDKCSSVCEIMSGSGSPVDGTLGSSAWATALRAALESRIVDIPDVSQYDWNLVAQRVDKAVALTLEDGR